MIKICGYPDSYVNDLTNSPLLPSPAKSSPASPTMESPSFSSKPTKFQIKLVEIESDTSPNNNMNNIVNLPISMNMKIFKMN